MEQTIAYSLSGQLPDRSRVSMRFSQSIFRPAPSDLDLDQALNQCAGLSLGGLSGECREHPYDFQLGGYDADYSQGYERSCNGRVRDRAYPGVYSGSIADSSYRRASHRSNHKAIEYPRSIPPLSEIDSRASRRQRQAQVPGSQYQDPNSFGNLQYVDEINNAKAITRYFRKPRDGSWADDMSVGPEDSVSQVSSRASRKDYERVPRRERRGRTSRRDDKRSMFSASTVFPARVRVSGGGGGGYMEQNTYGIDESAEPQYYTRDITPWK